MSVQSAESEGGDSPTHMNITGDDEGNSVGVYAVIRSWKRHSTDGILGVSQGERCSSGKTYAGSWNLRQQQWRELKTNRMK